MYNKKLLILMTEKTHFYTSTHMNIIWVLTPQYRRYIYPFLISIQALITCMYS